MEIKFDADTSGLDKFKENLEKTQGEHSVSTDEMMTEDFISRTTDFDTWQKLMDAGGVKTSEDLKSAAFNTFVASCSDFESFKDMIHSAATEYMVRRLGF